MTLSHSSNKELMGLPLAFWTVWRSLKTEVCFSRTPAVNGEDVTSVTRWARVLRSVKWKHESAVISHALKSSSLCRCWRQTVWVAFSRLTLWPAVFGRCWILSTCLMALPSRLMRTSCFWLRPVSDILSSKSSSAALSLFIYQMVEYREEGFLPGSQVLVERT